MSTAAAAAPWPLDTSGNPLPALLAASLACAFAFLAALYTRLRRDRVLDHEARRRVYEAVCARPASTASPIARALGVHSTTVEYHLEVLARHGLVVSRSSRRGARFFPTSSSGRDEDYLTIQAWGPSTVAFLRFAAGQTAVIQVEAAKALGLAPSTVCRHAEILASAGCLAREGPSMAITARGRDLLDLAERSRSGDASAPARATPRGGRAAAP
jgi:predicted transcriptional regulator